MSVVKYQENHSKTKLSITIDIDRRALYRAISKLSKREESRIQDYQCSSKTSDKLVSLQEIVRRIEELNIICVG